MIKNIVIFCFNCGLVGHRKHECKAPRRKYKEEREFIIDGMCNPPKGEGAGTAMTSGRKEDEGSVSNNKGDDIKSWRIRVSRESSGAGKSEERKEVEKGS